MSSRPLKFNVPTRRQQIELYEGFRSKGFIPHHLSEISYWRDLFERFSINSDCVGNWAELSLDLRLASSVISSPADASVMGRAALSKKLSGLAKSLADVSRELRELSFDVEIMAVTWSENLPIHVPILAIGEAEKTLTRLAKTLKERKQTQRWREAQQRSRRTELAALLTPVFQAHFGVKAVPCGGSHVRQLDEANEWTRFFQAVAFALFDERVTPDRQAVLWEATKWEIVEKSDF
ncbi:MULTISPECIES: hypothetical protein [unclassified Novosphingobium]|uniref:hypothetical protein n=1 Tax=unclassified Novosphingobium TaxID=2644732 RepID=UPI0025F18E99|nr:MULTISPECIES: hypothetical protein [unclassified Novosphingobium]